MQMLRVANLIESIEQSIKDIIFYADMLEKDRENASTMLIENFIKLRDAMTELDQDIREKVYYYYPPSILYLLEYLDQLRGRLYQFILDENREAIKNTAYSIVEIMREIQKNMRPMPLSIS